MSRSEQLGRTKGHLTGRSHFNGQSYEEDRQEEHEEEDRQEGQEVSLPRQASGSAPSPYASASDAGLRRDSLGANLRCNNETGRLRFAQTGTSQPA